MSLTLFFLDSEAHIDIGAATTYDIEIQFLKIPTGNPHPRAHERRIFAMNVEWEKPPVGIEIVGENLVPILLHANGWRPNNRTFIYEWKAAVLKVVCVLLTFSCACVN